MGKPTDLVQGTVDLLILKTLALEPMHGWAIAQRIKQVSRDVLKLNQNAHGMSSQALLRDVWLPTRRILCHENTKTTKKTFEVQNRFSS
jgi:PadR family transcriptional regulator PadR